MDLLARARPTLLLDDAGWHRRADGVPADDGVALIIASSGSGGEPGLVELDRGAVDHAVRASAKALGARPGDGWLACLPLAHVGGLLVVLRAVLLGAPLEIQEHFTVAAVSEARAGISLTSLVPTMLSRLLGAGADLGHFRKLLVGGSAIPPGLRRRMTELALPLVATYGQTQSCGGVVYDGVPLGGVQVAISAAGEIELGGPTVMRGYRLDPERALRSLTAAGRLRTGDAGHIDASGRLQVEGRLDDLIITGGEKVWPAEVEAALLDHHAVADAAVTGSPDPEWGMRVIAYIVPVDPRTPPTLGQLRDFVAERMSRHKAPAEVVLTTSLPRTALGKVRRGRLRASAHQADDPAPDTGAGHQGYPQQQQ